MTRNFEKIFPGKRKINIDIKTIRALRSIAKDKGVRGCYKLKKANLIALLLNNQLKKCQHRH